MTYNGAAGETARAMAETLRFGDLELDEVNRSSAALLGALDELNPQVEVKIANSLWARQDVEFLEDFLERNRVHFGAEIRTLDFSDPDAKDTINAWVARSTKEKIGGIVDRVEPDDVLFLINAIYFAARWDQPFPKGRTTERRFHLPGGKTTQHPMMSVSGVFLYLKGTDFQAVKLPYSLPNIGMYVILPVSGSDIHRLLESLRAGTLERWIERMTRTRSEIMLPRFKLTFESRLNDVLISLGMGPAFSPSQADFSAMRSAGARLYIDRVRHKTVVGVDEQCTEAAAVTVVVAKEIGGMIIRGGPEPFEFIADRPFFFAIRDDKTGAILFMGALYEPFE